MEEEHQEQQTQPKKTKKKILIAGLIVVAVVIIIIIAAASGGNSENGGETAVGPNGEEVGNSVGDLAPDFTVVDFDGNSVELSDFKGTPVIVNFWATWCPFCVDELPLFSKVQKEFGDAYVTLAVDRKERQSLAQSYTDDLGVTDDLLFAVDDTDRIYDRYGGFSMPYSVFIDSDGVIRDRKQGPLIESELRRRLESILPEGVTSL